MGRRYVSHREVDGEPHREHVLVAASMSSLPKKTHIIYANLGMRTRQLRGTAKRELSLELGTSCAQGRRATRLRYAPTVNKFLFYWNLQLLSWGFELFDVPESMPEYLKFTLSVATRSKESGF